MADYTTVQAVRAAMNSVVANSKDGEIERVISAVSRHFDRYCNRPDGFVAGAIATARVFAGTGTPVLRMDDAIAVALVEAKANGVSSYVAWAAADWVAFRGDARRPDFNTLPVTGLISTSAGAYTYFPDAAGRGEGLRNREPTIRITARWGYAAAVPYDIEQACIMQVTRLFKRGESAFANSIENEFGTMTYRALDPEVSNILKMGRYVRPMV